MLTRMLSLSAVLLAACASSSQRSANLPALEHRFAGTPGAIILRLRDQQLQLPDRVVTVVDCSDVDNFCLSSPDFALVLPKRCQGFEQQSWRVGQRETRLISVEPHTDRILVSSTSAPDFAFVAGPRDGVSKIYYDSERRSLFAPSGGWANLGYARLRSLIFGIVDGQPLFACTD